MSAFWGQCISVQYPQMSLVIKNIRLRSSFWESTHLNFRNRNPKKSCSPKPFSKKNWTRLLRFSRTSSDWKLVRDGNVSINDRDFRRILLYSVLFHFIRKNFSILKPGNKFDLQLGSKQAKNEKIESKWNSILFGFSMHLDAFW